MPHRAAWVPSVLGLLLLLVLSGAPVASTVQATDERPAGATTYVYVSIDNAPSGTGDIALNVDWETRYPARSEDEARRAQNGTLDTSWFRGEEEMASFAARYPDADVRTASTNVHYRTDGGDHGEIHVVAGTTPRIQFDSDRDRIEIGPQLAQNLSDGDRLTVEIDRGWNPEAATIESQSSGLDSKAYVWEIGTDPSPRFVLNESGTSDSTTGGDLGSGPIVAVVALALVATLLAAGAKYRDRT